ncbi:MAG TPA: aldose epimerase family protein [Feifaniaceae bacterium]|nr:aldose epimerase family protein [Feifaniaceae bacterium]
MQIERRLFGTHTDGTPVYAYRMENANGVRVELISYGAALRSLFVPDRNGGKADVVLGYDDLAGYQADVCYFGATIGRIGNRIRNGAFTLNGRRYQVAKNDGEHHLHGGAVGFNRRNWPGEILSDGVAFTRYSPDGEEGYPGGLQVNVRYRLADNNALRIEYLACAEESTVCNLTNHSYFNLAGHDGGSILSHELTINAPFYTPGDGGCVPTGEILSVAGTPMDFTKARTIGRDIGSDFPQVKQFGGYDHNFVLSGPEGLREIAVAHEPKSGRRMRVLTDLPGVQLYTGNMTDAVGKGGIHYGRHAAFCLETQYFPDAVNHRHFEGSVLKAGETFKSETVYQFSW